MSGGRHPMIGIARSGGPAEVTGTPIAMNWGTSATPAASDIAIPADTKTLFVFWHYWDYAAGHGVASATLGGQPPTATHELAEVGGDQPSVGVCVWELPPTGTQSLQMTWDGTPVDGPAIGFSVCVRNKTGYRDVKSDGATNSSDPVSVTLTTVTGDLCLRIDTSYSSTPATPSGCTSLQTVAPTGYQARLSSIVATGSTQVATGTGTSYASVCGVSIG